MIWLSRLLSGNKAQIIRQMRERMLETLLTRDIAKKSQSRQSVNREIVRHVWALCEISSFYANDYD